MSQPNTEMNSTVDKLAHQADSRFSGGTGGVAVLNGIVILSGILSAIFFWENSPAVFSRVWPPIAIVLGLAVGLMPSEGAFFGWRKVRETKAEMTAQQMKMTAWGIATAVFFSVFSTFALFVSSFQAVPETVRQYSDWFTFVALSAPILIQFALFAVFVVNETAVIQNHERAKQGAMQFSAHNRFEKAKLMATILGMEAELNRRLSAYGAETGLENAASFLDHRAQVVTDRPDHQLPAPGGLTVEQLAMTSERPSFFDRLRGRPTAQPEPQADAATIAAVLDAIQRGEIAVPVAMSNPTHDAHAPQPTHAPGRGENGPAAKPLGAQGPQGGGSGQDFR